MPHITDAILMGTIASMPDEFEAHELIRRVMTTHPQEYVRELYRNIACDDPIRETHRQIGRRLHEIPGISPHSRADSPNVRGPVSANQKWRKLPSPPPGDAQGT